MDTQYKSDLSRGERLALWLPLIGGVVFGILPLFPVFFSALFGFSGNDGYIYQLAGAATFGYVIPLWYAVRGLSSWEEIRYVIIATLTFNIVSLYACFSAIVAGNAPWVVYAILATSIAIVAITTALLYYHGSAADVAKNVAGGAIIFLKIVTLAAFVFGILPLFSKFSSHLFGYLGTDTFLYHQAGAATLGYAIMGLFEIRSGVYRRIRLPLLMTAVFNGVSFLAGVYQIITGHITLLVYLVTLTSLVFTIGLSHLFKKSALAGA